MVETVTCPSCGRENGSDQRFCGSCGVALTRTCPVCGTANLLGFAFCGSCGTRLSAVATGDREDARRQEERRRATVLFADISGFTSLSERMDPEDVKSLAHRLTEQMAAEVGRFGGSVVNVMGDAIMAVFGAPVAHEDDAERAVRAALAMRDSVGSPDDRGPRVELHIGINTGEVMAGLIGPEERRDYTVMGDVTNTAARMQSAAAAGEILVGQETYEATVHAIEYREHPPIVAKGKEMPVAAWSAVAARGVASERVGAAAPLVGREAELTLLASIWQRVRSERQSHLVTILGQPGVGKSRLLRELAALISPQGRLIRGRCLPYGETTGYGAFGEQVKQAAGILESDPKPEARAKLEGHVRALVEHTDVDDVAAHLGVLLGLSEEGAPDKQLLFLSARLYAEALAREQPTVLAFEDVHWAQPALLELLQSLAVRVRGVPLLVAALARPEFLDAEPTWGGGLARYSSLPLEPLSEDDARRLAGLLLSRSEAEKEVVEDLIATSGGNPLFLEELAASVAERAAERARGLPTTVQAIIAARLDALPADERRVLQDASVVGRFFWRGALAAIGGDGSHLDGVLDALELRDFVRREPTSLVAGDREYVFKHILIMEVAYGTLPRSVRRERHAIVATYLEEAAGDRIRESASVLAHHWKEAGQPARAAPYLVMAAEVASRAWSKHQAISLFSEAIRLSEEIGDSALGSRALLGRVWAGIDVGDYSSALRDLEPLLADPDAPTFGLASHARARIAFWQGDAAGVHRFAEQTLATARRVGDPGLEARAEAMIIEAAGMDGDLERSLSVAAKLADHWSPEDRDADYAYTRAQTAAIYYWRGEYEEGLRWATDGFDLGMEASSVNPAVNGAAHVGLNLTGLCRHEEGLEWLDRAIRMGREWEAVPRFTGRALNMSAGALREIGDLVAARAMNEEALEAGLRAAFPGAHVSARIDLLIIDLLEGEVGRAERRLPDLVEAAEGTSGWHQWLWSVRLADARARIALEVGEPDEAVVRAEEALGLARWYGRRKYAVQASTLAGRALLDLGRFEEAIGRFEEAARRAEGLRQVTLLWPALDGLATALSRVGRDDDAERARERVREVVTTFAAGLADERRARFRKSPAISTLVATG